jgi:hypothetical protein
MKKRSQSGYAASSPFVACSPFLRRNLGKQVLLSNNQR